MIVYPLQLKVWWIPQIPMEAFEVSVQSISEAKLLLDTLANYDIFQFESNIKPDYCNAGGLNVFVDGEWIDWNVSDDNKFAKALEALYPEKMADDIDDLTLEEIKIIENHIAEKGIML